MKPELLLKVDRKDNSTKKDIAYMSFIEYMRSYWLRKKPVKPY